MKTKKLIYSGVVCIVLVATTALSAFAIKESIVKEKNAFQIASDKGIPISEVDKEQNFKYTTISTNAKNSNDSNIPDREDFSNDPKANIYNKMLNTIDFFNEIELTMETSMLGDGVTTVKYQTNIDTGCSYQSVTENGVIKTETYSESGKKELIHVDNLAKTYNQKFLATYERSDTPYVPLEKRIFAAEDGIPCYTYRRNVTNCSLASYSIVPQEITFSYLKDFDKWEISKDNVNYLDRTCIEITGSTAPYIAKKHNSDTFKMLVDSATGVLMRFEGIKDGKISRFMYVKECSFMKTRSVIKQFDKNMYASYTEVIN